MRRLLIFIMPVVLSACINMPEIPAKEELEKLKKELKKLSFRDYTYTDSRDSFAVQLIDTENQGPETDNVITTLSRGITSYSGSYLDHLKNGNWLYTNIKNNITITWFPYSIKRLGILTNLPENGHFSNLDEKTMQYGLFTKKDSLQVQFHADTLTAQVKRRPYEDLVKDQMESKGFKVTKTENKLLQDSANVISVTSLTFSNSSRENNEIYCKVAYAVMKTGYLAFAVKFTPKNKIEGSLLFDGVLTNLFFRDERFYYPYTKFNHTAEDAAIEVN